MSSTKYIQHVKWINRISVPKMLNYRPNGWRRLGRPLKRLLDKAETGLSQLNWWGMMMNDDDNDIKYIKTWRTRQALYIRRDIVAHSCNHCWRRNIIMMSAGKERQQWVPLTLLSSYKTFYTAVSNIYLPTPSCGEVKATRGCTADHDDTSPCNVPSIFV